MRKRLSLPTLLLAGLVALGGCDFLDPTGVDNPTVTEETFLNTPNAASSWTRGVERQLATAVDEVIMGAEVVSDNVFNNRTLFSKVFDLPRIDASDFDVTNIQSEVQRLREMADQGLTEVAEADEEATAEIEARLHFYRAYANLLAGELFVALPAEPDGPAVGPEQHLANAVQDFQSALDRTAESDLMAAATLGIARAQYAAGNMSAAVAAAQQVIAMDPSFARFVQYDDTDGPTNTMQFAIYDSPFGDEFQPLPRLDFLFPKYYSETAGDQSPIAILKGEEAYLILAEAALAQGDLAGARARLVELLDLVESRPTAMIDDRGQERGRRGGTWIYPNSSDILVAPSPGAEPREGLVLTRSEGLVEVPILSGTSVTEDMLDAAATADELLYLLYMMRQEIFVVEGRRMTDLGIRFPVALDEALTNPEIDEGSSALQAQIPAFIPRDNGLDSFDYEDGDTLAVIHNDMNAVLVENRTSEAVLPFH
jgi:tetratricopeptide (TPR) repeat protein